MITVRPAAKRGHFDHGWLETWHTFSFASYRDPAHEGFRSLRVLNEDIVQPGQGFPLHTHRDMEILTWVLEGALEHRDSFGGGGVVRPGDMQRMTAGTGISHSEYNHSTTAPVHLLQIWIVPERRGLRPESEKRTFERDDLEGRLRLVASPDGAEESVRIHQDARVLAGVLTDDEQLEFDVAEGRHAWVQVALGRLTVNGTKMHQGDGAAVTEESKLLFHAERRSEILVFDLA